MKKKGGILSTIILIIALGVFAYSGYQLYLIYGNYKAIDEEYDAIRDAVVIEDTVEKVDKDENADEEVVEEKKQLVIDFDALTAINDDVVGWIHFDEPLTISYPIVQANNNDKYLHTSVEGKYLSAGSIFLDYQNDDDFKDENTLIYGHNMKNGSMFGQLKKYRKVDFCKENPYFYIYTVDGRQITYQIFAVKVVGANSDTYDKIYREHDEFQKYLDKLYKSALYTSDEVTATADDRIVTLSTCTGNDETRLVVCGVVVDEVLTGE